MKKAIVFLTIILVVGALKTNAQSEDSFRYQASILDKNGDALIGRTVSIRVSILEENGTQRNRIFTEFHQAQTDDFGIIDLRIGSGNAVLSTFSEIDWSSGGHYLKVEMDETGGTQFKELAEIQLLSVPYALHAKTAENVDDEDADPVNELQNLTLNGNILEISQGNSVELPESTGNQQLSINGNILEISQGNSVELPENTDNQQLTLNGNELSISNGNTITLANSGSNGEIPDPQNPVPIAYQGQQVYVHPTDNSEAIIFGSFDETGATSNFDGSANTALITAVNGVGSYAAKLCEDLEAFGFDDWYLPSRAELDAIYKQNYLIQGYEIDEYWSSTETEANKGFVLSFDNGSIKSTTKNQSRRCRCVRK